MKKIISCMLVFAVVLGIFCSIVKASAEATFVSDKTEVKQGETFTVTLSVSDTDGINGVMTEYSYDENSLELQEAKIGPKLVSLGAGKKIETICNSGDETNIEVISLTFKVKDDAEVEQEVSVSTEEITISNFGESDSKKPAQNVKIKVVAKEEADKKDEEPKKEEESQKEDNTKEENSKENSQNQDAIKEDSKEETKKETITPEAKEELAPNKLPKTGFAKIMIYVILGLGVIAIISYVLYKRYNNI